MCQYGGELLSSAEVQRRHAARVGPNYILTLREIVPSRGLVLRTHVDATARGGVGRFLNHR